MREIKKSPPKIEMLKVKLAGLDILLGGALERAHLLGKEPDVAGINATRRKVQAEIDAEVAKTKKP